VVQLYEQSQRRCAPVASRYVGDDAEDVVQDAFLKVASLWEWVFAGRRAADLASSRIVVNAVYHRCRRRKPVGAGVIHGLSASDDPDAEAAFEISFAVRTALRGLTRDQRKVVRPVPRPWLYTPRDRKTAGHSSRDVRRAGCG